MLFYSTTIKASIHILLSIGLLSTVFGVFVPDNAVVFGFERQTVMSKAGEGQLQDLHIAGKSLLDLHRGLVDHPSVSGDEESVALYLEDWLKSVGFTVEKHAWEKNRYNLYAYVGNTNNTKVLVTSHIDTVPPYIPYRVEGSKIYGRGAADAKASVASQIFSVLSLLESKKIKKDDVGLLFVVGEEVDGSGMKQISENVKGSWQVAIFGEPTELKLGVGHKGMHIVSLKAHGKASHSGYPELGISASETLIPVLNDLLNLKLPESDLLGPSTLNIGQFSGGVAANVVPAEASAFVSVRVAASLEKVIESIDEVVAGVDNLEISSKQSVGPQYLDFEVPGFDSIVLAYSTDVPNIKHHFNKRYLYGPGSIHVAHADNEYVENKDLLEAVEGYSNLITYALANHIQ